MHREQNIEPAEPDPRQSILLFDDQRAPTSPPSTKAVSFGRVSFTPEPITPEPTSLITATTDNPAAFANRVIRCV